MERKTLESTGANYPYLQGLWAIPFGIGTILTGFSNLQNRPSDAVTLAVLAAGIGVALLLSSPIARYYREKYGSVQPTRDRFDPAGDRHRRVVRRAVHRCQPVSVLVDRLRDVRLRHPRSPWRS